MLMVADTAGDTGAGEGFDSDAEVGAAGRKGGCCCGWSAAGFGGVDFGSSAFGGSEVGGGIGEIGFIGMLISGLDFLSDAAEYGIGSFACDKSEVGGCVGFVVFFFWTPRCGVFFAAFPFFDF